MHINRLNINGFRSFLNFSADFRCLEVIVGANGAGKSSLFEFLRFLRDSVYQEIPPELLSGAIGQQLFHVQGPELFQWNLDIDTGKSIDVIYSGELIGPVGRAQITQERVESAQPFGDYKDNYLYMNMTGQHGVIQNSEGLKNQERQDLALARPNQLALSTVTNPRLSILYGLRAYIEGWRFYSSFNISSAKIRRSVLMTQEPKLHEDAGNLSAVLHFLMTEHPDIFQELQSHLKNVIPGFRHLTVKARGDPGEVIAFWSESGLDTDLSLADLSDGSLRLLCWIALCLVPNPPPLICLDEPDLGVHPRTLPVLAGLFKKAANRTQIFLTTHASYFLMQFGLDNITVIRKRDGASEFAKPSTSQVLKDNLNDFGIEEIEAMHRSDELETFA